MNEHTQDNNQADDEPEQAEMPSPGVQPEPKTEPARKFKLTWGFVIGLLGWFVVNGLLWLWWISPGERTVGSEEWLAINMLCFPLNVGILFVLGLIKTTRPIAAGILAAMGLNFIISLIFGLTLNAVCLLPFFIGGQL